MVRSETVVIGAGAAGLFSSLFLSKRDHNVTVLFKGFGATALSSGCFDILGYSYKTGDHVESYVEAFRSLPDSHPYKIVSRSDPGKLSSIFLNAINLIGDFFKDFLHGDYRKNMFVATLFGTIKPTAFVQKTMKGSILKDDLRITIVGIEGIYDFYPPLVKEMLKVYLRVFGFDNVYIDSEIVKIKEISDALYMGYTPYIQVPINREKFYKTVKKISKRSNADVILIPPIVEDWEFLLSIIEETNGRLSEVPAPPLYKAGYRLVRYLMNEAKKLGVNFIHVDNIKLHNERDTTQVKFTSRGKKYTINTNAVIVASGDLIGGGLKANRSFKGDYLQIVDSIFNSKIAVISGEELRKADYFSAAGNPLTKIGFKIDENLRSVGKVNNLFKNLYFSGSVIGGYDYNFEKSGLGVTLVTAYKAVESVNEVI